MSLNYFRNTHKIMVHCKNDKVLGMDDMSKNIITITLLSKSVNIDNHHDKVFQVYAHQDCI